MNFTKLPNKGHSLNKGQWLSYQSVRYLESLLYPKKPANFKVLRCLLHMRMYEHAHVPEKATSFFLLGKLASERILSTQVSPEIDG